MLLTLFILKLTLDTVVKECNRMVFEEQNKALIKDLKSKLFQIQMDFESGNINQDDYSKKESEILRQLHEVEKNSPRRSLNYDNEFF